MKIIKNIILCGLGAIGGYYAAKISDNQNVQLKILVDKSRYERYKEMPRIINGKKYDFDYILPSEKNYKADLIIIATKSSGLKEAIENINNFVSDDTIILSFLNGINSEKEIAAKYGDKVLYSFLLGHTFFRTNDKISHDGQANIIFGSTKKNDTRVDIIKSFFEETKVSYKISGNIMTDIWNKFAFNCCVNQLSGISGLTFGEMLHSQTSKTLIKNICVEISTIAKAEGISDYNDFFKNTMNSLKIMLPSGKTSMLQDIEAKITPEIDLFGKTIVKLGAKHNIPTPYNKIIVELLECKTEKFKH